MGNDTIYLELHLTVGVVRCRKLPGYRQFKDKKKSPSTINNYLLKRIGVTVIFIKTYCYNNNIGVVIIYPLYLSRDIVALLFRYEGGHFSDCIKFRISHRSTRERERERERETERGERQSERKRDGERERVYFYELMLSSHRHPPWPDRFVPNGYGLNWLNCKNALFFKNIVNNSVYH